MGALSRKEVRKQENFVDEIIPHLDALYNFALQLTADPNDAKDLVQNTLVKAYRFFHSYEKGTNARAWMFRILNNSYINDYRTKSKQPAHIHYDEVSSFFENVRAAQTNTTDLEDQIFHNLIGDDISNALEKLQEKYRTVILLRDLEDFTYEEISNMLNIPIGTVRSRLHRARNLLKKSLLSYAEKRGYKELV